MSTQELINEMWNRLEMNEQDLVNINQSLGLSPRESVVTMYDALEMDNSKQDLVNIIREALEKNIGIIEAIIIAYTYGKYESNELGKINTLIDRFGVSSKTTHKIYSIAQRLAIND